jgi:hypothetical protein
MEFQMFGGGSNKKERDSAIQEVTLPCPMENGTLPPGCSALSSRLGTETNKTFASIGVETTSYASKSTTLEV